MSPAALRNARLKCVLWETQGESFVSNRINGQLMPAQEGAIMHFWHFLSVSKAGAVHSDILLSSIVNSPLSAMLPTTLRSLLSSSIVHFMILPVAPTMKLFGRAA